MDADALAHIHAKEAADGDYLPEYIKDAIEAFVVGCKADASPFAGVSNWDAIKTGCLMAGSRTMAGALSSLKGEVPINYNFVEGDYDSLTGLKGDGTKWLSTGRDGTADPQDNCHLVIHLTEENTVGSAGLASHAASGNSVQRAIWQNGVRGNTETFHGGAATPDGTLGVTRHTPSEFSYLWAAGYVTAAAASAPPVSGVIGLYARSAGGALHRSDMRCSFYSIGEAVDLLLLKARIADYMAAIATPTSSTGSSPRILSPYLVGSAG